MSKKVTKVKVGVLRLYDPPQPAVVTTDHDVTSEPGNSHEDTLQTIRDCHRSLSETQYSHVGPVKERKFVDEESAYFGENGGTLKGKRFSLRSPCHKEWRENPHCVRVREQDPESPLELPKDGDINHNWHNGIIPSGAPIYDVEICGKFGDTFKTKMDFTIFVEPNRELDTEFIVIWQDELNPHWNDITNTCTMENHFNDSMIHVTIPIEKSSRVWVVRVKRSLHHVVDVLLALVFGHVLFRILIFCKVQHKEVHLRIIGINEEYQGCPTAEVCLAKENGFQMVEASNAKQLIKTGKLLVSFNLSGICQKSVYFDLDGGKVSKVGQREDFKFAIGDLECIPKLEVQTANEAKEVLWIYDIKNIINVSLEKHVKHFEHPRDNMRPALASLDDEVKDEGILWLAHHVNKDWSNLGICLGIKMEELDIIKGTKHNVVDNCSSMLHLWQEKQSQSGNKAIWHTLQAALELPVVGRLDIFRYLHMEEEIISDLTLLELAYKVGRSWKCFGKCLDIPAQVIEIIDSDEQDVIEKGKSLLQKWRQGANPSVEKLVNALRVMKRDDLAKDFETSCRV